MSNKVRNITVVSDLCDGCNKCVRACEKVISKVSNKVKKKIAAIKLIRNGSSYFPIICRNCEDAPCVTACISGCRKREEGGWVTTNYERCVGCWMCVMNCPFGAIEMLMEDHVAIKCDGCLDKEVAPCVASCKTGVLSHMDINDYTAQTRKEAAERFLSGSAIR